MTENLSIPSRPRVLSGMRPTGRLHLGNYMGALYNWVQLQHQYECYFFIADWHALTTDYADPSKLQDNTLEVALDFLACGLDPKQCTIFVQSHVLQHAELHLLFSMFTPVSWLERVPTYKDQQEQLREKDLATYGFLGYPLLQSADILLYTPHYVPVGQDQVAHVELTREVARRFNQFYSPKAEEVQGKLQEFEGKYIRHILPEPQVLLTPSPKLPGLDGRKMSKSYGNTIMLTDQPPVVFTKMESMSNGGQRPIQSDPGNPDICPVADLHRLFSALDQVVYIEQGCRTAAFGCLKCKQLAASAIIQKLGPIQEKRLQLENNLDEVVQILADGATKASERAETTITEVRGAMGLPRKFAPTRLETSWKRIFRTTGQPVVHNIEAHKDWWDFEPTSRARNLQSFWLEEIIPSEIKLKRDSDRVFITPSKKRVYVTTSREDSHGTWEFYAKPKSYEMIAILCWDKSFHLHDFVIPQKVYVEQWTYLKKQNKNADIHFEVRRDGDVYTFELDGAQPVVISEYKSNYESLR